MANWIVKAGHNLYLYDVSKHYLTKAQEKFSNDRNITIVDPDSYNSIANQSIDMVIVSSVTQYLTNLQSEPVQYLLFVFRFLVHA